MSVTSHSAPRRTRTGDARDRAAEVLVRTETDEAFASAALAAAIERDPPLSAPERALATELVYGVLRTAGALDARLQRHASRPGSIAALDPYARAVVRIAAYQLLALARVPPHAAVNSAVTVLTRDRSKGLAGFANAVLRKVAATRPAVIDDAVRSTLAREAVPDEVRATIAEAVGGGDEADRVLAAMFGAIPDVTLRANPLRATRDNLLARLTTECPGAIVRPGAVSPLAVRVQGAGDPSKLGVYVEGACAMQEEGAQAVALATGARPGMRVLDACAGRGGKTGALAAMMAGEGTLHAVELHPAKAERIAAEIARLGYDAGALGLEVAAVDLTRGLGGLSTRVPAGGYDVVLVDAPCSGLGTLARRPDAILRATGRARGTLPAVQRAILERVAPLVAPGGVLVYAVCTLARDEGPGVVDAFCRSHPEWALRDADAASGVPERVRGGATVLRPDTDGTDGFMVFRLGRAGGT